MLDYRSLYRTADEAVSLIKSGQRVYIHSSCAQPTELVDALTRRGEELHDVEVCHMATMGPAPYTAAEFEGHFRHNGLFLGANVRRAVQEGRGDYTPIFLSDIESLFRSRALPIDVCLLQCSPPDDHGYMNLGVAVEVVHAAVAACNCLIVEINDRMPHTFGETYIHVSRADALVPTSHRLVQYAPPEVTDVHRAIGRRIANLVPDGATIQTGIGGIPEATLSFLGDHKDLGIHSEMIPDSAIDLIESGVINGVRKTLHPRRAVAGFVLGTDRLFDYIRENPAFNFLPTGYVNDPFVIAQNDRMVAINSAIEVDLTGQVCSDSVGYAPYSGFGGQVDFLRGAARSKGGLPIIALPSTAKSGAISRIVPTLQPGAGVVTSRGDVHYVITEHGAAYLHGKTIRQRVEAMIGVADPSFRSELEDYARQHRLLGAREPALA